MKRIGIVCDDYKVPTFKKALAKEGFTDIQTLPFLSNNTTQIHILISEETFPKDLLAIKKVCQECELLFKRGN